MPQRLAQHLIARGLLHASAVDQALKRLESNGGSLDTVLLEMSAISEAGVLQAISDVSRTRLVNLADFEPNSEAGPLLPLKMARQLNCVPLSLDGKALHVACAYPVPAAQLKDVGFLLGRTLELWVALECRVKDWLSVIYGQPLEPRYAKLLKQLDPSRKDPAENAGVVTESLDAEVLDRVSRGIVEEPLLLTTPKPPKAKKPTLEVVAEAAVGLGEEEEEPRTSVLDATAYARFAKGGEDSHAGVALDEQDDTRVLDITGYKNFAREVSSLDRVSTEPEMPAVQRFPGGVLPPRREAQPTTPSVLPVIDAPSFVRPASAPRPASKGWKEPPEPRAPRAPPAAPPAPTVPAPVLARNDETDFSEVDEASRPIPSGRPAVAARPSAPGADAPVIEAQLDTPSEEAIRRAASMLPPDASAADTVEALGAAVAASSEAQTVEVPPAAPVPEAPAPDAYVQQAATAQTDAAAGAAPAWSDAAAQAPQADYDAAVQHEAFAQASAEQTGGHGYVGADSTIGDGYAGADVYAGDAGYAGADSYAGDGGGYASDPGGAYHGSETMHYAGHGTEEQGWQGQAAETGWQGAADQASAQGLMPAPPGLAPSPATEWTLAQARTSLKAASQDREYLVSVILEYGRRTFDFVAAFACMRGAAVGWDGRGDTDEASQLVRQMAIPLDAASVFRTVALTRGSYVGPLPPDALSQHYLTLLGRQPRTVFLWPVEVQSKLVAILYGDCGTRPISQRRLSDFILFCQDLPPAFHELILFRKQHPHLVQALATSEVLPPTDMQAPQYDPDAATDDDWFSGLITLLTGPDASERSMAMSELMRTPEESALALAHVFPGPTGWSRLPVIELPEPDELGPIPGALARLGQAGALALAPLLDSDDDDTRYLALLTAGATRFNEVVEGVVRGLFDFEPDISSAARAAATALKQLPRFQARLPGLRQELASSDPLRRSLAARALGVLHDLESVDGLINLTGSEDELCAQSAAEALKELTRASFGTNPEDWRGWWARSRGKRRIEWLVEALESEDFDLRLSAIEELSRGLGDNHGYFADGPDAERAAALTRIRRLVNERRDIDL